MAATLAPQLARRFTVPGRRPVRRLSPGLGAADPDAALPAGFEAQRWQFELVVFAPIVGVILSCAAYLADRAFRSRR